jgi:putative cell wall-binding protein
MDDHRPTRENSRRVLSTLLTVTVAAALSLAGLSPASAADGTPPVPFCPPGQQTIGTHVTERLYDTEHGGGFTASITSGTLPAGAELVNASWYADYAATPSAEGSYDFTVQLTSTLGTTSQATCHVDVDDAVSLEGVTTTRIAGSDRYDVAANISRYAFPTGPQVVYVASGEVFADAVSVSAIAAQRNASLLLTRAGSVPNVTLAELARLQPHAIVIVGGTDTISSAVETELAKFATTVKRVYGVDRYEVSRFLITDPSFGAQPSTKAYIASGNVFPDALAAGPAAANLKAPVLLVDGAAAAMTVAEIDLLQSRGVTRTSLVGGPATISTSIEAQVGSTFAQAKRLTGADRFEVSAAVARDAFPVSGATRPDTVYLATGVSFPDALSGAVIAATTGSPIYLAHTDCIPQDVARHIDDLGASKVVLLGGTESLNSAVADLVVCT